MQMKRNIGGIDKGIRIFLGFVLIAAGLAAPLGTGVRVVSFAVAAIALVTAFTGF